MTQIKPFIKCIDFWPVQIPPEKLNAYKQLIDEGNAMRNCIGRNGYDERIVSGKSLIVFLYKDGKPFVDIEIDREHWTVRQCYTKFNHNPEEKINAFAKFICDKAKAIYRKAA